MIVASAAALLLAACGTKQTTSSSGATVSVDGPERVQGNVVPLNLTATGFEIVKADGDTSGKTGHFHIFIDREPVAAGAPIPTGEGIVHSAETETKIMGLTPGERTFTVVLGDGTHRRIGTAVAKTTVTVEGPGLDASAPASVKAGDPVTVAMKLDGATAVAADGDTSGKTGHFHIFIDRDPILTGPIPKEDGIVHTIESAHVIEGLAAGDHVIWVVFGDGAHTSFSEPVMDKLTVAVA